MTDYLLDTDPPEGREILDLLFDHLEQDRFVYEHRWREHDLAIWDNRCLVHARVDFDPAEKRLLRRFALQGDRPC